MHLRFSPLSLIASAESGNSAGSTVQLLILLMIPLAMYFLLFRPQRKRVKDAQAMQSSLGIGDEVVLSSGIYGFITGEEGSLFWVEIDDDVQVRVAKAAIQGKVNSATDDAATGDTTDGKSGKKPSDPS
ncbi:MAG TPA: preprotein translocase subunit YajC [Ilumatobacter sp.]|nr:preprotein translocase subunit YajC [Ilumatobacter sp.]